MKQTEYKFRAYHRDYKVFVKWEVIKDLFEGLKIAVGKRRSFDEPYQVSAKLDVQYYRNINIFWHPDFITTQYIGLEDSNDKEIYEGDILETNRGIGEVVLRNLCWLLKVKGHGLFSFQDVGADLKIISNIWDNPELIS